MTAKTVRYTVRYVDSVIKDQKCDKCKSGPCRIAVFYRGQMVAYLCSNECLDQWEKEDGR